MTNLEKMKTGTRKVNSCSVNSLVFAGFQGQNTGNTPNANTTDNNNNNNYVVGNSNRKRPYSAGTFVDNHKLNSKLRGYMQWSESSKTLTGSKLLERLHYLSSEKRPPSCENTASAINSLQNKNCLISEDNSGCLYTKVSQSIGIFKKMPDSRAKKAGRFKGNQDDAELLQLVAGCNVLSANNQKSQNEVSPPTSVQNQSRSQRPITKKELSISVPYS